MWDDLDSEWHAVVELAERFAAGVGTTGELDTACKSLEKETADAHSPDRPVTQRHTVAALVQACVAESPVAAALFITYSPVRLDRFTLRTRRDPIAPTESFLCNLFREVFGNPFRPVAFDKGWRSGSALSLARTMYESRDFAAMPILADALQDAGCENEDVLNHCRDPKRAHVRGCWVVDLVLGKV